MLVRFSQRSTLFSAPGDLMAKDKPLKTEANLPKRKKLLSNDDAPTEETIDKKVKKKKRKLEMEEAPVQIPAVKNTEDDKTEKKIKNRKKKQKTEETSTTQSEISDPTSGATVIEGEEDLSPEERRVLERKMKKILKKEEKKRLKADGETPQRSEASGPSASQLALDYLSCWLENRSAWKFQKTRQTWLLQHMFDSEKVPDEKFSVLLQYLEGLRGAAKETTAQKALSLVEESGRAPEDEDAQQRAHRAREVIQLLS